VTQTLKTKQNDTANDQDMNTSQVSEINEFKSDLTDREGDIEKYSDKEKNKNVMKSLVKELGGLSMYGVQLQVGQQL
jgi:hypothetical protein